MLARYSILFCAVPQNCRLYHCFSLWSQLLVILACYTLKACWDYAVLNRMHSCKSFYKLNLLRFIFYQRISSFLFTKYCPLVCKSMPCSFRDPLHHPYNHTSTNLSRNSGSNFSLSLVLHFRLRRWQLQEWGFRATPNCLLPIVNGCQV